MDSIHLKLSRSSSDSARFESLPTPEWGSTPLADRDCGKCRVLGSIPKVSEMKYWCNGGIFKMATNNQIKPSYTYKLVLTVKATANSS